jgi:hypothetical protein
MTNLDRYRLSSLTLPCLVYFDHKLIFFYGLLKVFWNLFCKDVHNLFLDHFLPGVSSLRSVVCQRGDPDVERTLGGSRYGQSSYKLVRRRIVYLFHIKI